MKIDHQAERNQVFEEAWRSLRDGFYDPQFHGQDWSKLKKQYKAYAMKASTAQDFRYFTNMMLGQLNASHMGVYGSGPEETQKQRTGRLGIEFKMEAQGARVTQVIPNTSATRTGSQLKVGDLIKRIDGNPLGLQKNAYQYLEGSVDEKVLLSVQSASGNEEIVIRPSRSVSTELYEAWVKERKALTNKYSNGKLGYIHIRGMNWSSFERFERELMASGQGKEGIVIDVRNNGGGWTTDMLMAVLNVRQHAYTIPRDAAKNLNKQHKSFKQYYPYGERLPLSALTLPSVALCNEVSYSNAEIFSHAFKHLGHGKLVGKPTFGAVISTGGKGLMDGSYVRMPYRAWYVKATEENMENGPAVPDYILENAPDCRGKNTDAQLKKAVDVLMEEIKG